MKVMVSIPAYNEEDTIAEVISGVAKILPTAHIVVIDDGSTDRTGDIAKAAGAHVVRFKQNRGLGVAFKAGLDIATEADVLVNIDADGQYDPTEIPQLIEPIKQGEADVVLGSRFKGKIEEMSVQKRIGNIIATKVTRFLSGYPVSDAQTGFRAFSREAILRLNVFSDYTYVQETIMQATSMKLRIMEVPCTFRKRSKGRSRLIGSLFQYAKNAFAIVLRTYLRYKPLKVFLYIGGFMVTIGVLAGMRVLVHFVQSGQVTPYYPTTILTAVLLIMGFQVIMLGAIADLIDSNRRIEEEILYRLKRDGYVQRISLSQRDDSSK